MGFGAVVVVLVLMWMLYGRDKKRAAEKMAEARLSVARALLRAGVVEHGERSSFDIQSWTADFFDMTFEHSYSSTHGSWVYRYRLRHNANGSWERLPTDATRAEWVRELEHKIVESQDEEETAELRSELSKTKENSWAPLPRSESGILDFRYAEFEILLKNATEATVVEAKRERSARSA